MCVLSATSDVEVAIGVGVNMLPNRLPLVVVEEGSTASHPYRFRGVTPSLEITWNLPLNRSITKMIDPYVF